MKSMLRLVTENPLRAELWYVVGLIGLVYLIAWLT